MPDATRGNGGECIPRDKRLSVDMDKQRLRTHSGGRVGSSLTEEDLCVCVCVYTANEGLDHMCRKTEKMGENDS